MRELIFTCKHHDGFCLWPSRTSAWDMTLVIDIYVKIHLL
ncbi:alpha-L-fucosidase [Lederbergia sp. NSJ-179]